VGVAHIGLEPLHDALLGEARQAARDRRTGARRDARGILEQAEAEARALLERARADGEAAAELEAERERARAQREARALVLETKQAFRKELERRALAAAAELRNEPRYGTMLEGLARMARIQLGDEAVLEVDPPEGGVIAHAGARRVDYSLPALVERCLAQMNGDLERRAR
jgi:vacuolar-type H+-ATPase subunit E/Vma4